MEEHLHIYTAKGRCTGSQPLKARAIAAEVAATDASRIQFQLMSQGMRLTHWHDGERAGILSCNGETLIARIKPTGLCRDMMAAGAAQILGAIRAQGHEVDPITGRRAD